MARYKVVRSILTKEVYEVDVEDGDYEEEKQLALDAAASTFTSPESTEIEYDTFSTPVYIWTDEEVRESAIKYRDEGKGLRSTQSLLKYSENPNYYSITEAVYSEANADSLRSSRSEQKQADD